MVSSQMTGSTDVRTIRIGDLARGVTEADLRGLMLAYGSIRSYTRPVDQVTKRVADFAFIEMQEPGASRAVAKLHGQLFRNHLLAVHMQVMNSTNAIPVRLAQ